jgi:cytochrome c553
LGVFVFPTLAFSQNTITLPIEVYPDDGRSATTESVTINASSGSQTDRVYFVMHQPFYHLGGWDQTVHDGSFDREAMTDVRLNGGSWVTVRDENVTCASPEETQGCVASGYATIRFSISTGELGSFLNGENTLSFRFNGTEGVRSGFRVLYLGLMTPGQTVDDFVPLPKQNATDNLIDGTTFQYWEPDSWTAPAGYDGSSFVSAGEALWSSENTLEGLLGEPLVAACGSCHASDGRDLQYFGYSNKTIVARSQSHGLTEDEGKKIAAYIRSLEFEHADGSAAATNSPGTPWDPPYQPGPTGFGPNGTKGPEEADPYYWAAGAGIEWALDSDSETIEYAFPASGNPKNPNGIAYTSEGGLPWTRYRISDGAEWGGNGGLDRGTAINVREIPISAQFPDWNNWLPDVHPHDGLDRLFDGSAFESHMNGGDSFFQSASPAQVEDWIDQANSHFFQDLKLNWDENNPSTNSTSNSNVLINQHAILGANQWRAVRVWELQHKYHFEDKANNLHCDGSPTEWCEPLGWLGSMRTVFDMAPHVAGSDYDASPYVYGTETDNDYFNHIWYQMQLIVNPGTDGNGGNSPIDEGYQEAFLGGGCDNGFGCGYRQVFSEWKFLQLTSNTNNGKKGPRPAHWEYSQVFRSLQPNWRKAQFWEPNVDTATERELTGRILEAFFRAANAYMVGENGQEGRIATVERVSSGWDNQGFDWNATTYDPQEDNLPHPKDFTTQIYNALAGNLVGQSQPMGDFFPSMSRGALDSLAAQGDLLSPDDRDDGYAGEVTNGWSTDGPRWHDLVDYTPPSTGSQTIGLAQGWNLISSRINPSEPAIESVFSGVDSDLSLVKNEAGDIYSPAVGLNNIGDWQSREGYLVYMTTSQSMSVSGYGVDPTTSFMLEEGWNLIPYYPDTGMTPEDAFASISSELVMVKNQAGETYVPDPQDPIDDIGQLQPGEAYKVYVSSPVSFSYPSN